MILRSSTSAGGLRSEETLGVGAHIGATSGELKWTAPVRGARYEGNTPIFLGYVA